ncbi:UvrD-helicase domain-containing protein [Glycomyces sp. NPDC021274]|uniref:UvrD-helicase domain-containing protein n=1 Tax=Glycomyces sp. NPDC021274 TaxID=3155120 RepID=UPI0033E48D34
MSDVSLTDDQKILVNADVDLFVAACPGAGKTRAMVARFLKRASEEDRRGIALVSFTNTAIDEVRTRCGYRTDVLSAPNFVGTFDAFLHRFIVTPLYVAFFKVHPRYVQSWSEVQGTKFRMATGKSADVDLEWFDFDDQLRATIDMGRVDRNFGNAEARKKLRGLRLEAEQRAAQVLRSLLRAGTVSCDTARFLAEIWISNDKYRPILGGLLRFRFAEIIVDEVQDCGREELLILEFLRDLGIRMVTVGDLDQAIYEFRSATPTKVHEFGTTLTLQPTLVENWRSSPAICAFNNSLRSQTMIEKPVGDTAAVGTPIYLVTYAQLDQILPAALSISKQHEVHTDELVLLAHKRKDALRAAGMAASGELGSNRVAAIADAGLKLRSAETDAVARRDAVRRVEKAVLAVLDDGGDLRFKSIEGACAELGIDERRLREASVRMAVSLSAQGKTRGQFAREVRDYFRDVQWTELKPVAPELDGLGNLIQAPTEEVWNGMSNRGQLLVQCSTVHGVKGREFKGVGIVIPSSLRPNEGSGRTLLDDWEHGKDSESRRVLYVGGSRAKELLMVFVHQKHRDQVARILDTSAVPIVQIKA